MKNIISNVYVLSPFDLKLLVEFYTDASQISGLAYLRVKLGEGNKKSVIQCWMTALTPAQENYSTTDLELFSIVWAVHII